MLLLNLKTIGVCLVAFSEMLCRLIQAFLMLSDSSLVKRVPVIVSEVYCFFFLFSFHYQGDSHTCTNSWFWIASALKTHAFGLWKEVGAPRDKHRNRENRENLTQKGQDSNRETPLPLLAQYENILKTFEIHFLFFRITSYAYTEW